MKQSNGYHGPVLSAARRSARPDRTILIIAAASVLGVVLGALSALL